MNRLSTTMKSNLELKDVSIYEEPAAYNLDKYISQVNTLALIRHLNLLIISGQKHRGASLALIGGDYSFEPKLALLKEQIIRRINVISMLNTQYGQIVDAATLRSIEADWRLLETSDCGGTIKSCFERHNSFIESLLGLMWRTASSMYLANAGSSMAILDDSLVDDRAAVKGHDGVIFNKDHRILLKIIVRLMPELIETIAKLRGVATYAAVIGSCDEENQDRLSYLLQVLKNRKDQLAELSKSLGHTTLSTLPAITELFLHEHKLDQLQRIVRHDVIGSRGEIRVNSQEIFDFATSIVEVYYKAVEAGVDYFQHKIERTL